MGGMLRRVGVVVKETPRRHHVDYKFPDPGGLGGAYRTRIAGGARHQIGDLFVLGCSRARVPQATD